MNQYKRFFQAPYTGPGNKKAKILTTNYFLRKLCLSEVTFSTDNIK